MDFWKRHGAHLRRRQTPPTFHNEVGYNKRQYLWGGQLISRRALLPSGPTTPTSMGSAAPERASESRRREESWPKVLFYLHVNVLLVYGVVLVFTEAFVTTILFSEYPKLDQVFWWRT